MKYHLLLSLFFFLAINNAYSAPLWSVLPSESKVAYGSIKNNTIGEVNHFKRLEGSMNREGEVNIKIDLTSVETFIDIRNQRMIKHVFGEDMTTATMSALVDLEKLNLLHVGETTEIDVSAELSVFDQTIEIDTQMFVARLSQTRLLVSTNEMVMVKTDTLGVDTGVDKLQELAKLSGITRVVPVTLRLVFEQTTQVPSTTTLPQTANPVALLDTDVKAGKKLYRQCMACHNNQRAVNTIGPHLVKLVGRSAGSVENYNYSPALKQSSIVWTEAQLAKFLANPSAVVPNNRMAFAGIANPDEINHLIAYLKTK